MFIAFLWNYEGGGKIINDSVKLWLVLRPAKGSALPGCSVFG